MSTNWRHAYRSFYYETMPDDLPDIVLDPAVTALLVIDLQVCYLPESPDSAILPSGTAGPLSGSAWNPSSYPTPNA